MPTAGLTLSPAVACMHILWQPESMIRRAISELTVPDSHTPTAGFTAITGRKTRSLSRRARVLYLAPKVRRGSVRTFTYSVGKAIQPVTLPAARHNDGTLSYSLTPTVPGLSFDPDTRRLTGTPSVANNYAMTYTVTNAQGYTDTVEYTIAVHTRLQSGDNNDSPRGIAYAKGRFYVLDDSNKKVYAYSTSGERDAAADFDLRLHKVWNYDLRKNTEASHLGIHYVDGFLNVSRETFQFSRSYSYDLDRYPAAEQRSYREVILLNTQNRNGKWNTETYGDGAYSFFFTIHPNSGESFDGNDFLVRRVGVDGRLLDDRIFESDVDIGRMAGSVHVGDRVYIVNAGAFGASKVYAFSASGERDATADFELDPDNRSAVAIAYANGRFYVADERELKVFAYTVSGQRDAAADFDLSTHEDMDMRNEGSDDVVVVQDRVYVLDRDVGRVFAYFPTGERDAAADFDLDEGNAQPGQIAYAEGRFYVVNNAFSVDAVDKVYAYTLDGRRDAGADFDLDERNHRPVGLTYAEGRFYVVDVGQKVYAYTLDGSRDDAADFELAFHNRDPAGIIYADGRFYVIDRQYLPHRDLYVTTMFAYRADGRLEPSGTESPIEWWRDLLGEWRSVSSVWPDGRQWESFGGVAYSDGQFHVVSLRERTLNLRSFSARTVPLTFAYPTYPGDLETVDRPVFFTVGAAIDPFTLPAAVGGVAGTETYSLSPDVPGLSFDPETRLITGTLSAADSWDMSYTVTDANGDTDSLNFTIAAKLDLTFGVGDNDSPFGPAYANGRLYVGNWDDRRVYAYSVSGQRDADSDFTLDSDNTGTAIDGITWADGRFYVVDRVDNKVYAYEANGQRDAASEFDLDSDNTHSLGITWAEGRFYVVDEADDKVYAYEANGQRDAASDFDLHADIRVPVGIAWADGRFYVVDAWRRPGRTVYAYNADGQRDASADFNLDAENDSPTGIAWGDGRLYVVNYLIPFLTARVDKLYAYSVSGQRDVAAEFDLHTQIRVLRDVTYAGDRLFVLDGTNLRTLAYSTSGERDPASDFDLDDNNFGSNVSSIAWGDGRFYILRLEGFDYHVDVYGTDGQRDAASDFRLDIGTGVSDIYHANGRLYVLAGAPAEERTWVRAQKVYAFRTDGQRDPASDWNLDFGIGVRDGTRNIAFADGWLYAMDPDSGLHAYSASGQPERTADIRLGGIGFSGFLSSIEGIAYANGLFYLANTSDKHVYLYRDPRQADISAGVNSTLSVEISRCSGQPEDQVSLGRSIGIEGTVRTAAPLSSVVISGFGNGSLAGAASLGRMAAGESRDFSIDGTIETPQGALDCSVLLEYFDIGALAPGAPVHVNGSSRVH